MNFLSNYKYKFLFNRFYKNKMSVRKYNLKRSISKVGIIFENDGKILGILVGQNLMLNLLILVEPMDLKKTLLSH